MNILMPMAGEGSRLNNYYNIPKPFIEINNQPMFLNALGSFDKNNNFVFVIKKQHNKTYNASEIIKKYFKHCTIIEQNEKLPGAAMSCLLAKDFFYNDEILVVCDSDIFIDFDISQCINLINNDADVVILYSKQVDKSYSYIKNKDDKVIDIAEKNVISNDAVSGVTIWKSGKLFFNYILKMIENNIMINNEFYISPSIKLLIEDGKIVKSVMADSFFHLGDIDGILKFKGYIDELHI